MSLLGTHRLRSAISDPVLIKPNEFIFLRDWNMGREPCLPTNSSSEHLYGIYLHLSDANANDTDMPRSEREKRQRKLHFQLKRRNSVLMANVKEEMREPVNSRFMRRSWSCMDFDRTYCREENVQTKRVSFSVQVPPPAYHDTTFDLCPSKIRPILVRRNTTFSYTGKDCLEHMDFDLFVAWRRGSKISNEVEKQRKKTIKEKQKDANSGIKERKNSGSSMKKEEAESGDCWVVRFLKLGFDSCFHRRRVTPSPPPSSEESAIVISIINAN